MPELPPEASPGLRAAQRALDRDLRLALEDARANNGQDRGPADNTPRLSETQIKDARDVAASLVNGHLKDGPLGWLRVAVHRFLRLLRYFEINESAPKPRPAAAGEQAGAGEQADAGEQDRQASGDRAPGSGSSEPTRESQQAEADQPGEETQSSQPSGDDESPPAPSESAPEPRKPITDAQVESWKATLNEEGEHLLKHEKERLERAIAVAYLISSDPDLQKLYEDPQQMQQVANMVALADWVADRYDKGPRADERHKATRGASASARTAPVHTYGDDQPLVRAPTMPALTYADDNLAVSPPGTPALTYAEDGLAVSAPRRPSGGYIEQQRPAASVLGMPAWLRADDHAVSPPGTPVVTPPGTPVVSPPGTPARMDADHPMGGPPGTPVVNPPGSPAGMHADAHPIVSPPGSPVVSAPGSPIGRYVEQQRPAVSVPGTPARPSAAGQHVAARDARPERVPPGNPRAASLTSLHSPKRPAGSPPPRPEAPDSSRPDRTAGQGRGRR
ncbi:hypothetical protein [Micromonospora maris]|uniref:hypothetical protein n=1 Tax=Micromonospora maris TaxID=1003110 RepID=UPI0002E6A884|nr:hypothetical protein [Micromonospora maris]